MRLEHPMCSHSQTIRREHWSCSIKIIVNFFNICVIERTLYYKHLCGGWILLVLYILLIKKLKTNNKIIDEHIFLHYIILSCSKLVNHSSQTKTYLNWLLLKYLRIIIPADMKKVEDSSFFLYCRGLYHQSTRDIAQSSEWVNLY